MVGGGGGTGARVKALALFALLALLPTVLSASGEVDVHETTAKAEHT